MTRTCSVCDQPAKASRGWCWAHYERWRKYGDPTLGGPLNGDHEARFWPKVEKTDTCWLWTGYIGRTGYGLFSEGTKRMPAHRWSYELLVGTIPDGLDVDHLCRVRRCVNPAHLEPVTRRVNIRRGRSAQREKTHCSNDHPFDETNTRVYVRPRGAERVCRVCERERKRA